MKIINIQEAKTHLSRLVEEALAGEELVIAKAGKPLVKLVPIQAKAAPRVLGVLKGQIRASSDCWEPDPELEKLFYEGDDPGALSKVAEDPS